MAVPSKVAAAAKKKTANAKRVAATPVSTVKASALAQSLQQSTMTPAGLAPASKPAVALDATNRTLARFAGAIQLGTPTSSVVNVITSRADFDQMADMATGAGAAGQPEVKFLLDRKTGQTYFIPKQYKYHYDFATKVLGVRESVAAFNREAYLDPNRRYVAGTVTAYDHFVDSNGKKGTLGLSFWSTDIVRAPLLIETYKQIANGLPFATSPVVYRPGGETQEKLLLKDNSADKKALARAKIPILSNTELSKGFDFTALNPGVSFGTLRVIHGNGANEPSPTRREVAIYADEMPADLPPVAGVATPKPQTYLSHDALKARQDDTPYAYARDILKDPKVTALVGKLVRFEVTSAGYQMRQASKAEADAYFESIRPKTTQVLKPDLSVKNATTLDKLSFAGARAYGTKSSNVAELYQLYKSGKLNVSGPGEPKIATPDGFAAPASWFDTYMKTGKYDSKTTFSQRLTQLQAMPEFKNDSVRRAALLADLQEHMEDAEMPAGLKAQMEKLAKDFHAKFPDRDMRIRSSSDSEDLQGFSGAGLFDSFTFRFADANRPDRSVSDRFQKVFASVFNERAYAEFDFYRIDPHTVAMAELVMPNDDDEIANGVVRWGGAIPGWDTITVNAQVGESLVTNPEGGAVPDSIVMGNYGFNGEAEIQYEQTSNQKLPPGRKHVLTDGELNALFKAMKVVQTHFAKLYGKENDPNFSIECEFKIQKDGTLLIKQARPWVA
ncbi:MAG: hypothetical protein IPJ65_18575 [Archangiaceae bacterium]|nr:hypothetical protein [Archangiaceae bacterium]